MIARRELLRGLFVAALVAGGTGAAAGRAFAAPKEPAPAGKKTAPAPAPKDTPQSKQTPKSQPKPAAKPQGKPGEPGHRPG